MPPDNAAALNVDTLRADALKAFDNPEEPSGAPNSAPTNVPAVAAASAPAAPNAAVPAPAQPPAPKDPFQASFEKLATQQAAFRKQQEQLKPYMAVMEKLPPTALTALQRAVEQGDPLGVLAATGFSYQDVASRLVQGVQGKPPEKGQPAQPQVQLPPDVQAKLERFEAMERQWQAQQMESQRRAIIESAQGALKGESFKRLEALGRHSEVLAVIEDYHRRTGEMPGATYQESLEAAGRVVEERLAREEAAWAKLLTPAAQPAKVEPQQPANGVPPGQPEASVAKTLTNRATAPTAVAPVASLDPDELRKSLINDPTWQP